MEPNKQDSTETLLDHPIAAQSKDTFESIKAGEIECGNEIQESKSVVRMVTHILGHSTCARL